MFLDWVLDMSCDEFYELREIWEDETKRPLKGYYDSNIYPLKDGVPEDFVGQYEKYKENARHRFSKDGILLR